MSQKAYFDRWGYAVVRGFLSHVEVAQVTAELERYVATVAPSAPPADVYYEDRNDPGTLKQMGRMETHDRYFGTLLENSRFSTLARELLGTEIVPKGLEFFNKPPGSSTPTPPHQDGFYFMLEPNHALTMWLALDPVDEENGCVRYVGGSHLAGVRPHARTGVLGFSQGITDYAQADRDREAPMHAVPGDLLIHHSLTIHRADANRSNRPRRSLGLVYYSVDAREDREAQAAYQASLTAQLSQAGRI